MQNIFDTLQSMPFYGIIAVDILPLAFKLFACNYDFFLCLCYIFVFILPRNNFYMQIYIVLFFCAYVRLPRHTHCPTKKLEHIREIISLEHLHNKKKTKKQILRLCTYSAVHFYHFLADWRLHWNIPFICIVEHYGMFCFVKIFRNVQCTQFLFFLLWWREAHLKD